MEERAQAVGIEDAYRAHRLALVRLAHLVGADREQAEDVVQTAFASAQPRWAAIDDPLAYLRRSVVNQVRDHQRRRYRGQRARVVHDPGTEHVLPPEVDETWRHIGTLPWRQRAVVVLHYYEDLSLTEVAALLGRPASTIRSDHRRALDRLRKTLA